MPHSIISRVPLVAIALAFAACSDSTAPAVPAQNAAQELSFRVEALEGGSSTIVEMKGAVVEVTRVEGGNGRTRRVRAAPSAAQWTAFWAAVDAAGVQRWTGDYDAEGFADGVAWSLRLAGNGVSVDSHGTNAWPDRDGVEHHLFVTQDFRAFQDALGALTGWEF